jgi:hypothetical protein
LDLIFDKEKIPGLKGVSLKDQLKLFKNAGAPNLQGRALPTKVNDIRESLIDAIDLHTNGTWKLVQDDESDSEDTEFSEEEEEEGEEEEGEEREEDEDETDWEDIEMYEN